jgi:adenylyltransferase/sulfurtransferase
MTAPSIETLRKQIEACEAQLAGLRQQLAEAEHFHFSQERLRHINAADSEPVTFDMSYGIHNDFASEITAALSQAKDEHKRPVRKWPLDNFEYKRYGRQLIMPEIGLQGTAPCSLPSVL